MEYNKEKLRTELKRGDLRAAAKVYQQIAKIAISAQYLEHFVNDRRNPSGAQGKHNPLVMYSAIKIAIAARKERENTTQRLVFSYLEMVDKHLERLENPAPANEPAQA